MSGVEPLEQAPRGRHLRTHSTGREWRFEDWAEVLTCVAALWSTLSRASSIVVLPVPGGPCTDHRRQTMKTRTATRDWRGGHAGRPR